MDRWSGKLGDSVRIATEFDKEASLLQNFFVSRKYIPKTDEERRELEEFSMITSAMALMIHVAEADSKMDATEKEEIIDDMVFQLEQRWDEYKKFAAEFGGNERKIINNIFDMLLDDYEKGRLDLDETIDIINMVFTNNPYSRFFLIRLCYYTAYADNKLAEGEKVTIDDLAERLNVDREERERIKKEVKRELKIR